MSIKPTWLIKGVIQMSEMLKKMGLFGIGVISLTKEKVEEFAQEMIKKSRKEKQVKELEDKINELNSYK